MATKVRIGLRCYNPYVPNEVWDLFKRDLRRIFKIAFPEQKFSITEFYWQGFSTIEEYLKFTPKTNAPVDWQRVWDVLSFVANEFGMAILFVYQESPIFQPLYEDTLFERTFSRYSLKSIKEWTFQELDTFLEKHTYEALEEKYIKMKERP